MLRMEIALFLLLSFLAYVYFTAQKERSALRLKIADYILKPVNYEEFGACIDKLKIPMYRKEASETENPPRERTILGITRYLTGIRIEQAKKLLLSSDLSVTEISQRVGYGDYRVFTKVFKKTKGVTPTRFRREFLIND